MESVSFRSFLNIFFKLCGSEAFRSYLPDLYKYYDDTLKSMQQNAGPKSEIFEAIPGLPLAGYTINCSKKCICLCHVDKNNLASGACMVTPFGTYDYTRGGHIILHDARVILE